MSITIDSMIDTTRDAATHWPLQALASPLPRLTPRRNLGARSRLTPRWKRLRLDTKAHHVYISYMSTAKSKPVVRKAAKATPAAEKVPFRALPQKATGHLAIKLRRGSAQRDKALSERLRVALGDVVIVNIADARTQMPK